MTDVEQKCFFTQNDINEFLFFKFLYKRVSILMRLKIVISETQILLSSNINFYLPFFLMTEKSSVLM